jgi:hypothetical protein
MIMVITSRLLLLKKQAAYLDYLIKLHLAQLCLAGQYFFSANTQSIRSGSSSIQKIPSIASLWRERSIG